MESVKAVEVCDSWRRDLERTADQRRSRSPSGETGPTASVTDTLSLRISSPERRHRRSAGSAGVLLARAVVGRLRRLLTASSLKCGSRVVVVRNGGEDGR